MSSGGGVVARLRAAPPRELLPLQVVPRDIGVVPVVLRVQAQLFVRLVPRGLLEIEDEPDLRRARAPRLT
jgi:hypothetical protein